MYNDYDKPKLTFYNKYDIICVNLKGEQYMKVSGLKFYEDKILEQRGERLKLKREKSLSMAGKIIKDLKLKMNFYGEIMMK